MMLGRKRLSRCRADASLHAERARRWHGALRFIIGVAVLQPQRRDRRAAQFIFNDGRGPGIASIRGGTRLRRLQQVRRRRVSAWRLRGPRRGDRRLHIARSEGKFARLRVHYLSAPRRGGARRRSVQWHAARRPCDEGNDGRASSAAGGDGRHRAGGSVATRHAAATTTAVCASAAATASTATTAAISAASTTTSDAATACIPSPCA